MSALTLPSLHWISSPNYSSRGGKSIELVVVHDCEGSYNGSIAWFETPRSQVSAHYVLDKTGQNATQMVSIANKAWHCVNFNSVAIGVEMEGFETDGFPSSEWNAMASVVAYLLHTNGLPVRWAQQGEGKGFCRHFDLGEGGGSHNDPTTDSGAWQSFIGLVTQAAAQQMPASWPISKSFLKVELPKGFTTTHRGLEDLTEGSIEWIQMNLNTLGVPKTPLLIDGLDGELTQRYIAAFQASNSISPTGVPDAATISALKKAVQPILQQ
jgi:N-acetyl-anhydromuramyl-L-alanine amidase AmpD